MRRTIACAALVLLILLSGPLFAIATGKVSLSGHWRDANRDSVETAPRPDAHPEAVVQVYAARAFRWRGAFGVHTWIAVKPDGAESYEVYEVLGWRARHGGSAVVGSRRLPDQRWYGAEPDLLLDYRGAAAEALIDPIRRAVERYPHARNYRVWPGPNSNTFTAFVAREVDGLDVELPVTAIGKDYLEAPFVARTPGGAGIQLSARGVLGLALGLEEGFEMNLLGLSLGVDFNRPALKLPGWGRIGVSQYPDSAGSR